jgi:hypothetical protein
MLYIPTEYRKADTLWGIFYGFAAFGILMISVIIYPISAIMFLDR